MKNSIVKLFLSLVIVGLLGLLSCKRELIVETETSLSSENSNKPHIVDSEYKEDMAEILVDAAEFNLFQMKISKLAQQKGTSIEVRELARDIVEQHALTEQQVSDLAVVHEVMLPGVFSAEKNEELNKLIKTDSKAFDRQYIHTVIEDNTDAIDALSSVCKETIDPDIKEWADEKLVMLKTHLAEANRIWKVLP
ncbi:DUF4142 domain-containing protein [Flavobacterium sp. NKUCC04_CG]|uniref:DUF4142 domain-containing protein n=1 Tax=Flavobacterium sp. NKUCC04_CG TaxID=2842121 RepID=UPI001C5AFD0E|nr:DUF4142 domain-containing protein [Flavobacterium sp. NKUCC04_CG]MBW3518009.1 DUF4142 domain-containing protein [Flavobacterium sp. NKUCC04_CG]